MFDQVTPSSSSVFGLKVLTVENTLSPNTELDEGVT